MAANKLQPEFLGKDESGNLYLGADCHQQQNSQVPVCVITDLKGNILLRNMEPVEDMANNWVITKARVQISRFWTASTAFVQLSIEGTDLAEIFPPYTPPLQVRPTYSDFPKTPTLPAFLMDEVCIYLGYINELRPVVAEDLTENKLLRVFIGSIDTVTAGGTVNEGSSIILQMRDRMKYLMDTLGSYNSTDFARESIAQLGADVTLKQAQDRQNEKVDAITRPDVILGLARRAVGHLQGSRSIQTGDNNAGPIQGCESVCGIRINLGYKLDTTEGNPSDPVGNIFAQYENPGTPAIPRTYIYNKGVIPFIGGTTVNVGIPDASQSGDVDGNNNPLDVTDFNIKFNIVTSRAPYNNSTVASIQQGFQVTDRVPVEYIKYLGLQEPWVHEFYSDNRSGEYWYGPRGIDLTGLEDKKRFFRTYFYRNYPESLPYTDTVTYSKPHMSQMCKVFREESSIIGWRSNILVTNSDAPSSSGKVVVHLKNTPNWLKGRKHACSYFYVTEPASNNISELAVVALSFARQHGKETRAGTMHVLGDPSMSPGECVQVIGSPLNVPGIYPDSFSKTADGKQQWQKDRTDIKEYYQGTKDLYIELASLVKAQTSSDTAVGGGETIINNGGTITESPTGKYEPKRKVAIKAVPSDTAAKDMCFARFSDGDAIPSGNKVSFPPDPKTMWRVEAVSHRFNDGEPGYYTEVVLLSTV